MTTVSTSVVPLDGIADYVEFLVFSTLTDCWYHVIKRDGIVFLCTGIGTRPQLDPIHLEFISHWMLLTPPV